MSQTTQESPLNQSVRLADGRRLGFAEYGDSGGTPVLFFHGTPGSRLMAAPAWNDASLGIRLIAPDRPGIGLSDYRPGRTLLNWADDVHELADALGLDRFVVAGVSGGGPHSLACAYKLGDRVLRAGVISGAATMDSTEELQGMHRANRLVFTLARRAPVVLRVMMAASAAAAKRAPTKLLDRMSKQLPPSDREILADRDLRDALMKDAPESYRQGSRAVVDEAIIFSKPWGFRMEEITVPVVLWHGTEDRNAPLAMAKEMERRIPNCTATYYEGEGHLYFIKRWPEIARALKGE
jgi:pimeloyl-ACP methyl ester carboxylesterase